MKLNAFKLNNCCSFAADKLLTYIDFIAFFATFACAQKLPSHGNWFNPSSAHHTI